MLDINNTDFDEPKIKILAIGVGSGGNNAINRMISNNIQNISFISIDTDKDFVSKSLAQAKIQIGPKSAKGIGTGVHTEIGKEAAEESKQEIDKALLDYDMVFIISAMGGGTGTGAAPVIASIAKQKGIFTIGIVTKPFIFEGPVKMENALNGIEELKKCVDSLIVIPNQKFTEIADKDTSIPQAFKMTDDVLKQVIISISNLILNPGDINVDFYDICGVMRSKEIASFGMGRSKGKDKFKSAIELAAKSPLLEKTIDKAKSIIVNIAGGSDLDMLEVNDAAEFICSLANPEAEIIFGTSLNDSLNDDEVIVTLIFS